LSRGCFSFFLDENFLRDYYSAVIHYVALCQFTLETHDMDLDVQCGQTKPLKTHLRAFAISTIFQGSYVSDSQRGYRTMKGIGRVGSIILISLESHIYLNPALPKYEYVHGVVKNWIVGFSNMIV